MPVCFVFSSIIQLYLGKASKICKHFRKSLGSPQEVPRKSPESPWCQVLRLDLGSLDLVT